MFTDLDLKMIIIYIIKSEKVAAIFRAHSSMPHPYPGPGVRFNRERDKAYALESGVQKARGGAGAGGAAWG